MAHYNFIPPYLYDPDFTRLTDKLICQSLSFLEREPRLKLQHHIHKPVNAFYCRNINWDNYEFVVSSYFNKEDKMLDTGYVLRSVSHNLGPDIVLNLQEKSPFFTNLSLNAIPINSFEPVFVNKGIYYQTFEVMAHDVLDDQALLNEQIAWTFAKNSTGDSVADVICRRLARYEDFRALFCVYDGNKKVQIHTEWDIKALSPEKFPNPYIQDDPHAKYEPIETALKLYWEVIGKKIAEVIFDYRDISVRFNRTLQSPKSYRRLAWGIRRVNEQDEFFELGENIPQIELFANPNHSIFERLSAKERLHVPTRKS